MYYTIYKITNKINGKIYIGSHKTEDLNDNYMGSGKYLKHSQEKHGIVNFEKEILYVFDTPEQMYAKEAEIVNEDFLAEENTYNLKVGGFGGWDYVNNLEDLHTRSIEHMTMMENARKISHPNGTFYGKTHSNEARKQIAITRKEKHGEDAFKTFSGKTHTEETKKKIGEVTSKAQSGDGNSQYGTIWIYSLEEKKSKKIKKTDPIPDGWVEGRKVKW